MDSPKVVLVGNYGAGNLGDDLLCLASVNGVRNLWPGCDLKVLAASPERIAGEVFKLKEEDVSELWPSGPRSIFKALWKLRIRKTWRFYKEADVIVLGGGGLLNAEVPKSLLIWGWQLLWARWLGKPVVMLGQSFPETNLRRWRWLTRWLLRDVELITVRDPISYRVIQKLMPSSLCKQTADLALTVDPNSYSYENYREPVILVNWRYYRTLNPQQLEQFAVRVCNYILEKSDFSIEFICLDDADRGFGASLKRLLPKTERFRVGAWDNCTEIFDLFEQASGVASMRLHGLLTAYLTNTPLFAFPYNDKVAGWLAQVELEKSAIDVRKDLVLLEGEFASRMERFLRQIKKGVEESKGKIGQIKQAKLNFEYLAGWWEAKGKS